MTARRLAAGLGADASSSCCARSGRFLGAWLLDRVAGPSRWWCSGLPSSRASSAHWSGASRRGAWLLPLSGLFMSDRLSDAEFQGDQLLSRHQHGAAAGVILFFTALAAALGPLAMGAVSDASAARAPASCWRRCSPCCCLPGCSTTGCSIRRAGACRASDLSRPTAIATRMKNRVQLICYADRLGGTLHGLRELLAGPFADCSAACTCCRSSIPSTAPMRASIRSTTPKWTSAWAPGRTCARWRSDVDVMADVIVNHVSSRSPQFLDFSAMAPRSRYAGLFLTFDSVFPDGATEAGSARHLPPAPGPAFHADDARRRFAADPLDDVHGRADRHRCLHPEGMRYLDDILQILAANGVRHDPAGRGGLRGEEGRHELLHDGGDLRFHPRVLGQRASGCGLEVLVEIHSYYQRQIEIARHVDWVYDFALPPLVLHAFFNRHGAHPEALDRDPSGQCAHRPRHARRHRRDRHRRRHPGPRRPSGPRSATAISTLVQQIHENSRGESLRATGAAASNLDLYQVNCTFYDALGRDDLRYLLARAIQFFLPGIPQVYYVGLLAGHNDMALLARTGVGRDINRHYYTRGEIEPALEQPVVERPARADPPAQLPSRLPGDFELAPSPDDVLDLRWRNERGVRAIAHRPASRAAIELEFSRGSTPRRSGWTSMWRPERLLLKTLCEAFALKCRCQCAILNDGSMASTAWRSAPFVAAHRAALTRYSHGHCGRARPNRTRAPSRSTPTERSMFPRTPCPCPSMLSPEGKAYVTEHLLNMQRPRDARSRKTAFRRCWPAISSVSARSFPSNGAM